MLDRRTLILLAGAVLAAGPALAATAPAFPGGDVALLRQAYGALHPGLLRYSTQAEVDRRFDALVRDFDRAPDLAGRYLALSIFLATVKCGHTYTNFYNQGKAVHTALYEGRNRLPFRFLWIGDRMIVTADPTGTGLKPGVEVASIDGRPSAEIIHGLLSVARADGSNDAKRRRLMSVVGADKYLSFDFFYPLLFGGREQYSLGVRDLDGRERKVRVDAIDLAARRAESPTATPAQHIAPWTLAMKGRVAVLNMPSWALYDNKWDWQGWLDARFEEMAASGATGLIVDLRENEGGEDCGDAIIARLIDAPLALDDRLRLVRYRKVPDALAPYLDTWDPSFKDWGAAAHPTTTATFVWCRRRTTVAPLERSGPRGLGFAARSRC